MKFRFPIVIIDEDFRSENTSGLGIRALAQAIESEGYEVMGVTSYGDLSQFAQQQSRASAFILSIDDEEFTPGPDLDPAVVNLRSFIDEVRRKNTDVPIYVYGETKTSRHLPNDILRELHGFIHMFEDTPEFVARHIIREAKSYLEGVQPPFFVLACRRFPSARPGLAPCFPPWRLLRFPWVGVGGWARGRSSSPLPWMVAGRP
jgi:hypothetical protein